MSKIDARPRHSCVEYLLHQRCVTPELVTLEGFDKLADDRLTSPNGRGRDTGIRWGDLAKQSANVSPEVTSG